MIKVIKTIKKRSEFLSIAKQNISYYSKTTLILARKNLEIENNITRVGYTVTKKIGNAVIRNKCKRKYRHIFRELPQNLTLNNCDYIVIARREILNSDFQKIKSDIEFCLKGILKKS